MINDAAKKLSNDECFSPSSREVLKNFTITVEECLLVWEKIAPLVSKFNGDSEKFLSNFYMFMLPGEDLFKKLPTLLSNLLCSEVACLCLKSLINRNEAQKAEPEFKLSEREIHSLQYLAGYCFRTWYTRLRKSRNWKSIAC